MKLLFDQQLSHKLVMLLKDLLPDSIHVRDVGHKSSDDKTIWNYAKENGLIIVTKDSDYFDFVQVFGYPPKIIWIKSGNGPTSLIANIIRKNYSVIQLSIKDPQIGIIELQ
jgi:predicted nuclease of predicted toxin-antitoxin system